MFIICCKVTKSRAKNQINLDFYAYIIYPHYIGIFNIHLRITILPTEDAEVKFYMKLKMNGVVLLEVSTEQLDYLNSYVIVIEAPTDPTSISAGSISADDSDAHYYDLQGHRLNTPPVQPGVYIYKGKKVVFPFYDNKKR